MTPQDLLGHACVTYRMRSSGALLDWDLDRDGRPVTVRVTGPLAFNEPELMLEAALDGLGIAYVLEQQAAPHLAAGRLVRLLEDWTSPFPVYVLYYPSRRHVPPVLAALMSALRSRRAEQARGA